jgi:hypothetical protein
MGEGGGAFLESLERESTRDSGTSRQRSYLPRQPRSSLVTSSLETTWKPHGLLPPTEPKHQSLRTSMPLSETEKAMWVGDPGEISPKLDDDAINEKYARGEGRIVIENNREKLPGFVNLMKQTGYLDLRPFYQRRPRWDTARKSLLIESFIMNIPVPPVFLYEKDYNSYEVMDGQQRINAISQFYDNKFKLTGLESWPELNGRSYKKLPSTVKAGLDRRSITSIVLLKESTVNDEEASQLRESVFERLNTGGIKLERQEIRNALYRSNFNNLVEELTRLDRFRSAWAMPSYVDGESANIKLQKNRLYAKMLDVEIVLRFFALRHVDRYRSGMQGFLDLYMRNSMKFNDTDVRFLEELYKKTINLGYEIYDGILFHPFDPKIRKWEDRPHVAFQDAVMIGLSEILDQEEKAKTRKHEIIEATKQLFIDQEEGVFTGRGNTKLDIQNRIDLYRKMLLAALGD